MTLVRDCLYLLPLAVVGGLAVGGAVGGLGASLAVGLCAVNIGAFVWLLPRLVAAGDWAIWYAMGFGAKTVAAIAGYGALSIYFGPIPVGLGLASGLGGVCIRRLLSADADGEAGYMGRPEGTGSEEAPE